MNEIFVVLTDSFHKSGFKNQVDILFCLISVVEYNVLSENLFSSEDSNRNYVFKYIVNLNANAFTHIHRTQIEAFALSLFNKIQSIQEFRSAVRDFLVNLKSFSGNNEELFEEEKKMQLEEARQIEERKRCVVPGLLPIYNAQDHQKINANNYNQFEN